MVFPLRRQWWRCWRGAREVVGTVSSRGHTPLSLELIALLLEGVYLQLLLGHPIRGVLKLNRIRIKLSLVLCSRRQVIVVHIRGSLARGLVG